MAAPLDRNILIPSDASPSLRRALSILDQSLGGLGTIATQDANNVTITGGSITGITDLAVADGGTGASTAADARTNLGLVIGTDIQAFDTELAQIAALADPDADRILFWDDSASAYTFLTAGTGLTITGTTIEAAGGGGSVAVHEEGAEVVAEASILNFIGGGIEATDAGSGQVNVTVGGDIGDSGFTQASGFLLGRTTASDGAIEEITVGDGFILQSTRLDAPRLPDIQVFVNDGTWTKLAGAVSVDVHLIAQGGGGAAGRKGANSSGRGGGGGGGGAEYVFQRFDAGDLGATEAVDVGSGGNGAAAISANDTNGGAGSAGSDTVFGTTPLLTANGGSGGAGGTTTGGAGGAGGTGGSGDTTEDGGAGGNGAVTGAATNPGGVGTLRMAGAGGGGGAGVTSSNAVRLASRGGFSAGAPGLAGESSDATSVGGVVMTQGGQPSFCTTSFALFTPIFCGGGGGGGGGTTSLNAAVSGFNNGTTGGRYGGGGGGGGSGTNSMFDSGAGGNGTSGLAVVVTYFDSSHITGSGSPPP
jgi:hypothetical protein